MKNGHIKTQAAMNKEMLLDLYAGWQQSHPNIVAKYPAIDPTWGLRRIDKITSQIGREILTIDKSERQSPATGESGGEG